MDQSFLPVSLMLIICGLVHFFFYCLIAHQNKALIHQARIILAESQKIVLAQESIAADLAHARKVFEESKQQQLQ